MLEGIDAESPWGELRRQIMHGEEGFVERFKGLLGEKVEMKEIPRRQRYADRRALSEIFKEGRIRDKTKRNRKISTAHVKSGYTLKEIANY